MSRNPPTLWYFNYHDYTEIKNIFDYTPSDIYDVIVANDLIKPISNTTPKELELLKTFNDLKKMILRHPCVIRHGQETCCNYINYWLNKTVRDSEYNVNKQNFNIFDKFMQDDPKIKEGPTTCKSKLSYMDTDTFKKMEKLYDLYDYFTKLKESKVPTTLCHNISDLTEKYESVFKECNGKDNNLCDKLTNLKNVIVKDKLVANNICTKEAFDSFILKIDPPREEQKAVTAPAHRRISGEARPPNPVSVSSLQVHGRHPGKTHPPKHVSVPSQKAHGRHPGEKPTPPSVSGYSSPAQGLETQARVESERTSSVPSEQFPLPLPLLPLGQSGPLESSETEETDEYARPKGLPEPELPQVELQEEDQVHGLKHDVDTFREVEEDTFLQEGDQPAGSTMPTYDTGTIMGTIKGAVYNVLEAVEPVPVLGVSGGMGALYLLLKCTPIGSLFRRNRRNNQNIPNFFDPRYGEQFSGYYPQYYNEGFSNYRMNIAYYPSSEELD
ncbi:variable surface protein Vir28-related [Plasmodium vivax]|uniref:Variable surface protein Vir28-related n=1 Tax=Plasmodium vivax (strain Salvador I) TaxID=126793 RepID=A5KDB8_PLAVS|nr:variable surface protein Vir28-related [Plasmodium vivax]EDL42651.1 variable surface protein Vir28-related [Plasmodium vivax]|eukprot:XP_001612444.1 variable surface protein Vir28-related [Plasmodium vivax Sal-1]